MKKKKKYIYIYIFDTINYVSILLVDDWMYLEHGTIKIEEGI